MCSPDSVGLREQATGAQGGIMGHRCQESEEEPAGRKDEAPLVGGVAHTCPRIPPKSKTGDPMPPSLEAV